MKTIDCVLVGHYALSISKQIQLAEFGFGKDSSYYYDALEKTFINYGNNKYTSSQLYNLFYTEGKGDISFDHVTFEHSFNTAISNIGTYLLRNGFTIDFVNTFNKGKQALAGILTTNEVLTVAIPTTFYVSAFPVVQIINFVRRFNSKAKIVVGGPFIRNVLSTYINHPAELSAMLKRLGADYFVYSNEGEESLARLITAIKEGAPITSVPNLYYRDGSGYKFTFAAQEANNFHRSASDWNYFRDNIPELVNIRTTKSCPFDCAFCGLPVVGGKWRRLPGEELEQELQSLHATGKKPGIFFIDETLNFPVPKFREMLQMMIRNKFDFKWEAEIRCDTLDRETVALMKESGCQLVHLGIESGSQQVLDKMSKRVDVNNYYKAMELLNEYGILTSALILIGFPGETKESFRETFDFIENYKPTLFRVHRWFYDHDTPVHQFREQYQITGGGYNWTHYSMDSATAHELATELSMNIRNSIHTDDYSMAFYLLNKGYSQEKVTRYLKLFDLAVKEKCTVNNQATIDTYIEQMKTALN